MQVQMWARVWVQVRARALVRVWVQVWVQVRARALVRVWVQVWVQVRARALVRAALSSEAGAPWSPARRQPMRSLDCLSSSPGDTARRSRDSWFSHRAARSRSDKPGKPARAGARVPPLGPLVQHSAVAP